MELGAKDAKVDAAAGAFVPFKLVLPKNAHSREL